MLATSFREGSTCTTGLISAGSSPCCSCGATLMAAVRLFPSGWGIVLANCLVSDKHCMRQEVCKLEQVITALAVFLGGLMTLFITYCLGTCRFYSFFLIFALSIVLSMMFKTKSLRIRVSPAKSLGVITGGSTTGLVPGFKYSFLCSLALCAW